MKKIPIYFNYRLKDICPVCGGYIQEYDYFGKINLNRDTRYYMCPKCNNEYLLVWDKKTERSYRYKNKEDAIQDFVDDYV